MQISELINTFQLTSFEIVVFRTLPKENLKLYFLLLDWELGSVRCCEFSFCAAVNHNNCSHIKSTFYFRKFYSHSHMFCKFLASSFDQSCSMVSTTG
jgi:hypothetical protein